MVAEGIKFPNYAGRSDVDDLLIKELTDAGIPAAVSELFKKHQSGEVKTSVYGNLCPDPAMPRCAWHFERAWYYWVAKGPGIPLIYATRLHEAHGQVVRVDGHCGCPSPLEWNRGFAIDHYHVDTAEGLKALADMIKKVAADAKQNA